MKKVFMLLALVPVIAFAQQRTPVESTQIDVVKSGKINANIIPSTNSGPVIRTTEDEVNYLTKGLPDQMEKGLTIEKGGYHIKPLVTKDYADAIVEFRTLVSVSENQSKAISIYAKPKNKRGRYVSFIPFNSYKGSALRNYSNEPIKMPVHQEDLWVNDFIAYLWNSNEPTNEDEIRYLIEGIKVQVDNNLDVQKKGYKFEDFHKFEEEIGKVKLQYVFRKFIEVSSNQVKAISVQCTKNDEKVEFTVIPFNNMALQEKHRKSPLGLTMMFGYEDAYRDMVSSVVSKEISKI